MGRSGSERNLIRAAGLVVLAAAAAVLGGCADTPARGTPEEFLDETTGATVTVVDEPLVFARERSERAANLRDYVTLTAASLNRAGKVSYVLIEYAWSLLDPRDTGGMMTGDVLVLTADDRRIALKAELGTVVDVGISKAVRAPPGVSAITHVFATDLPTIAFLGASRSLRAQTDVGDDAPYYELWDDKRGSLSVFYHFANGER